MCKLSPKDLKKLFSEALHSNHSREFKSNLSNLSGLAPRFGSEYPQISYHPSPTNVQENWGKLANNILSPYPCYNSFISSCTELKQSNFPNPKAKKEKEDRLIKPPLKIRCKSTRRYSNNNKQYRGLGWNQNIFSRGKVDENRSIGNIQYKGDINAINIKKDKRKEEIKRAHMHIHTSSAISNSVILESPNHQDHHKHKIQFIRDLIRKEYKWSKRRYINHKQNADLACISLDAVNGQSIYNRLDERKDSEPQSMRAAAPNKKAGNEKLNISASLSTLRSKPKPPSIYKKNKGNYPSVGILHQCKRPVIRNSGEGGTKIYKLMVKKEPIIHSRCKSAINYHPNTNKSNDLSLMKDKSDVKPLIYFGRDQIQFLDLNTMNRGENRREAILDLDEQAGSGMKNIPNNILNNIPNNIYSNQLGNNRHKGSISNTVRPPKLTIQGRNNNSNKSILDTYTSNNNSSFFTLQKTKCGNKRSVQLEKRENHAPMLYIGGSVSMSANKEMRRCKSSIGNLGGQSGGLDNMRHKDSMRHKDNMRRGLPEINSQGISSVHTNNNVNKCTSIQNKDLLM